ncbi:hypothetical protein ACKKBG_A06195 [Auxenochlorella protothecoides x Auxenochlorella symbiontica]
MSVSTRQSAPDTARGTTDPVVLRARQLNKEAQQRFRQRQAALVQDQESRLVAGQEEIASLKQENRVLRRSIDLQLRVLGCRDAMLAAFRDGAHLNPARQRPAGREMSTEPQALPGQQPSSPQPRDEEGAGRACLGASPKYQAHDASPGSGSGHPVLQAPCGGVAARAEAASGVEGEHCEEWEELLEGSIHTADDVRDFFDRWQARNALLVRDYLARRNAASRERLEGHMAHMMRIWEGLYQRLGLLVLAVVLELVVQRGSQAGPPDLAAAKLLRLVSSENLSKMGAMVREESAARAAPGRECQEAVAELMGLGSLPCGGEQLSMGASASLTLRSLHGADQGAGRAGEQARELEPAATGGVAHQVEDERRDARLRAGLLLGAWGCGRLP